MPELNGIEFVQRVWEIRPRLPVLMITAHDTREVIGSVTRIGVQHVVIKPFTPGELLRGVAAAVAWKAAHIVVILHLRRWS